MSSSDSVNYQQLDLSTQSIITFPLDFDVRIQPTSGNKTVITQTKSVMIDAAKKQLRALDKCDDFEKSIINCLPTSAAFTHLK